MFINKFDDNGELIWSIKFGQGGYELGNMILLDKDDNILTTGVIGDEGAFLMEIKQ